MEASMNPTNLAVPNGFETVTQLGPATSVHLSKHHSLLPMGSVVQTLVVYRDGFAVSLGKGKVQVWTWSEIVTILSKDFTYGNAGVTQVDFQYTFEKQDGEKVTLNEARLEELNDAVDAIKERVYASLRPPLQARYNAGTALVCGPVTVSKAEGLKVEGKTFAWNDLLRLELKQGSLQITTRDTHTHKVKAAEIPNVEMVCQIIGMSPDTIRLVY
jgi:hypothetical protein